MKNQEVYQFLESNQINASVQRAAIMQYMMDHYDHPTVDQIYADLQPVMPTLSKATVYNTLKLFVEKKAALAIFIDEKNVRYDALTHSHAHFRCKHCDAIYDIPLDKTDVPPFRGSSDFSLSDTQIYYFGTCKDCNDVSGS